MTTTTATVLFTDLVGSTALLSRVGQDRAEELRREHFGLLRDVVDEHQGREVKNLGDGLMISFDSVTAALSCATEIQTTFEFRNRDAPEPLLLRVGVSHGEADVDDGDYFGVPVVEAARLCARAGGGEILTTDLVRLLAASRGSFEFEPLGALELKGLVNAVVSYRVRWEPRAAAPYAPVPLPTRVSAAASATFVGRTAERERLDGALKQVRAGERRIVLLSGEPGIGKTSLATDFAQAAFDDGAIVIYGRSDEDLGIPYQPWVEALRHLVNHLDLELLRECAAGRASRLAHLVPEFGERADLTLEAASADAEAERYLLFGDVVDLLSRASASEPVLLILDDLHWADKPSAQLLRHVAAATVPLRLLILATFRDSEIGADHPLSDALAALHRERGVERIPMDGLDDAGLLALMEAIAGHDMDDDGVALRDALLRETDGNPFFVAEILLHLAETGAIQQGTDGRWIASTDIRAHELPVSVREVVGQRVKRLGPETVSVLQTAAVIGRDFDLDLLSATMQLDPDELLDVLDGAIAAGLLEELSGRTGRYSFTHALIEHTLFNDLTANRRARVHRVIAERLEELCGDSPGARLGELARHWSAATVAVNLAKPARYAQQAAEYALGQLAPDEAIRWFSQALELLAEPGAEPDERRRCTVLVGLGEAQRQVGDPSYRATLLEAAEIARRLDFSELLVRSALANNRGFFSVVGEVDEPRLDVLRAALAVVDEAELATRAKLLALLAVESIFGSDFAERLVLVREAVDAARATRDPMTIAEVLARTHVAIQVPETLDERLRLTTEAWEAAREVRDPFIRWLTETVRMNAAIDAGDVATIDRCLAEATATADALGQPHPLWEARFGASSRAMLRGDPVAAEQLAIEALEYGTSCGEPDVLTIYGVQLIGIRWQQGRLAELIPLLRDTVAQQPLVPGFRAILAWALASTGDIEEAAELTASERRTEFAARYDVTWLSSTTLWADTAARIEDRTSAALLFDQLEPWAAQMANASVAVFGITAQYLGKLAALLGDDEGAERFLTYALETAVAMEAPFFAVNAQVELARMLTSRAGPGDDDRALGFLGDALATARDRGYAGVEREALALLSKYEP